MDFIDGQIVLTTENGDGPSNIIILEPEVFEALRNSRASLHPNLINFQMIETSRQSEKT